MPTTSLFVQLWWILPLLIAAAIVKTPAFKGWFGEWMVKMCAKLFLDPKEYVHIHNVTLKTPDGTTQIDHIFVSRFGVFVVETKNYRGWIFGDEHQPMWTQKIFKATHKFQNPLRQNYKHTKALVDLLNIPPEKVHSVVVFVGGSEFKTKMPANVTYTSGFVTYIKSKAAILLTHSEVQAVITAIGTRRMAPSLATNREHVQNIQRRSNPEAPRICPKCGNPMVLRIAKNVDFAGSKFWGCSAFPKCRSIQKID